MEVRRQQQHQQQHAYEHPHQHRQVTRPLLVSSSTRSTPPSSPGGDNNEESLSSSQQKCTSIDVVGDTWILSHGSWTKKNPEMRYTMTGSPLRSTSPSSKAGASSSSHSQKKKNKKKRGSSSSSSLQKTLGRGSSRTTVAVEQREVATLLRAESTASDASATNDETSDNDISESSFSERLEYMSRLAERNRKRAAQEQQQQMRSQPPSPPPSHNSNRHRRGSSSPKLTRGGGTPPVSSSTSNNNTRDGGTASSSSSPPRALFLRNHRNSSSNNRSRSSKDGSQKTTSTTNGSPPPEPSRPAYLTLIQKHSSLGGSSRDKSPKKQPGSSKTTPTPMTAANTNHPRKGKGLFNLNRSRSFSGRPTTPPQTLLLRPPSSMSDEGSSSTAATTIPKSSSSYINDAVQKMNNTLQQNGTILAPVMQRSQSAAAAAAARDKPQDVSRESAEAPFVAVESSGESTLSSSLAATSPERSNNSPAAGTSSNSTSALPTHKVHAIRAAFGKACDIYDDVLCVSPKATDAQIRIAYFRRGRQVLAETTSTKQEPEKDKKNGATCTVMADLPVSAKEKFQAVSLAYEILCKHAWKKEYDAHGWKLVAPVKTSDTTAKPDCQVTTSTTITDIPGVKITSTTSTAEETPSPRMDSPYTVAGASSADVVLVALGDQASSILRHLPPSSSASSVSDTGNDNNGNGNATNGNDNTRSASRQRIRWSEEVEELVYRQDPDERRFKVRGSAQYHDSDSESGESEEDETTSSTASSCSLNPAEDDLHEEGDDSAGNAKNESRRRRHHLQYISQELERTTFDEDDNSMIEVEGSRQKMPRKPTKKKRNVVDPDSIHRKLSKLEKKTFENTFVASFLNDIDRSLDGLEDSFDGMFGGKKLADYDDDDDEADNEKNRNNDTSVKSVGEKKPDTTSPQTPAVPSEQLITAQEFPSSPNTVIQDVDDDTDPAVQDLFSELTKPARVLFQDEALPVPDSIPSSKDNKTPTDDAKAIDTSMDETDRAFSPVLHKENTNGTFGGLVTTKSEDFEDAFDPFNDSFQSQVPAEEEEEDDGNETEEQVAALAPAQAVCKVESGVGEFSCSTPSSLTLNREPGVDPFLSKPFDLRRGSTCKRKPLHPSSSSLPPLGTPPRTSAAVKETFHMSTPSPAASPIRGDAIFPRTHSGMSSLTGPASCDTNDTEVMLKQAEGNLCTMMNKKEDAQSGLEKKSTEKASGSDTNQDFFAHVMSYMDALTEDIKKFSQGPCQVPCQVVDETTQVIFDAVVIPEENLESMLVALKKAPATCAGNAPTACTTPWVDRSYTL